MFQQSILESLQSIFGEMGWSQLTSLTPESIASGFAQHYGIDEQDLPPGMFQSISPEMLQAGSYKTYSPQLQAKGQSLLSGLYGGLGGKEATKAAGGFAGGSGFGRQQSGVKDVYGKEMAGAIGDVGQQYSQGLGLVSDLVNQWHEQAQRISIG